MRIALNPNNISDVVRGSRLVLPVSRGNTIKRHSDANGTWVMDGGKVVDFKPADAEERTVLYSADGSPITTQTFGDRRAFNVINPDGTVKHLTDIAVEGDYKTASAPVQVEQRNYSGRTVARAAAAVLLVLGFAAGNAQAGPLGNPLNAVTDSTPSSSYAKPAGYGNLTGADGDVSSPIWGLGTDLGFLGYMNGANSTPIKMIDTGISGLTGVAYRGVDLWALAAGKSIYEGTVTGTTWHTDKTILVTGLTSDLTDLDWALGAYFVSTGADGIRKVLGDGTSTQIDSGFARSLDLIAFKPDTYDNPMWQFNGNTFSNSDFSGTPFGGGKLVDIHAGGNVEGVAYFQKQDGSLAWANVLQEGANLYDAYSFEQHMQPLPEPATLILLISGLGMLGIKRFKKQGILYLPENTK